MASDIVECPHCYTRVLPNREGTCPSCAKNVNDTHGADPTRTSVSIETNTLLPAVCSQCAAPTDRTVLIVSTRGGAGSNAEESPDLGWNLFAMLLRKLRAAPTHADRPEVSLHVPQCPRCAELRGRPKPRAISYERASMVLEVHRDFRSAVEAALE
jgi:hypothetical protein